MSRARSLSLIGAGAALAVIGVALGCDPRVRPSSRPVIAPSPDSVFTTGPDPVPTIGYTRQRRAVGCRGCKVDVWIGAYASAWTADTAKPPETPLKIARIINTGRYETERYDLKAYTQYDLLFRRGADGRAELVFEPITRSTAPSKKSTVGGCPGHPILKRSDADFRSCERPLRIATMKASMIGEPFSLLLRALTVTIAAVKGRGASVEDPAWFSCTSGCCTAMAT